MKRTLGVLIGAVAGALILDRARRTWWPQFVWWLFARGDQ